MWFTPSEECRGSTVSCFAPLFVVIAVFLWTINFGFFSEWMSSVTSSSFLSSSSAPPSPLSWALDVRVCQSEFCWFGCALSCVMGVVDRVGSLSLLLTKSRHLVQR